MNVMQARVAAAQAAVTRFEGRALAWSRDDCVRLAAFVQRQLKHPVSLAKAGSYRTEAGAAAALKRAGFDTLEAALDAHLPRIAPAMALPGDVLGIGAKWAGGEVALFIALGNGRALGFHAASEDAAAICCIIQPLASRLVTAWRAGPCLRP